jgi:hypothetical protein
MTEGEFRMRTARAVLRAWAPGRPEAPLFLLILGRQDGQGAAMANDKLRISNTGDRLFLTEGPEGWRSTPYDPEFGRKMEIAAEGLRRYRNPLRELAK